MWAKYRGQRKVCILLRVLEHTVLGRRSLWGYGSVHSVLMYELPGNFCIPLSVLIWSLTCRTEASFAIVQYSAKGRGHYFRQILWAVWLENLVLVCFCNSLADCFKTWRLGNFVYGFQINSSLYRLCQSAIFFFPGDFWWIKTSHASPDPKLNSKGLVLWPQNLDGRKALLCAGIQCGLVLVFLLSDY